MNLIIKFTSTCLIVKFHLVLIFFFFFMNWWITNEAEAQPFDTTHLSVQRIHSTNRNTVNTRSSQNSNIHWVHRKQLSEPSARLCNKRYSPTYYIYNNKSHRKTMYTERKRQKQTCANTREENDVQRFYRPLKYRR